MKVNGSGRREWIEARLQRFATALLLVRVVDAGEDLVGQVNRRVRMNDFAQNKLLHQNVGVGGIEYGGTRGEHGLNALRSGELAGGFAGLSVGSFEPVAISTFKVGRGQAGVDLVLRALAQKVGLEGPKLGRARCEVGQNA